jgi:hypothetical protein
MMVLHLLPLRVARLAGFNPKMAAWLVYTDKKLAVGFSQFDCRVGGEPDLSPIRTIPPNKNAR